MKITALTLLTIFTASSQAFGLNGGAKNFARVNRKVGFNKPALVQPVDIAGNRITSPVVSISQMKDRGEFVWVLVVGVSKVTRR